jgi:hypothetical protein
MKHQASNGPQSPPQGLQPLDPGRINTMDPVEMRWWCHELGCSEERLEQAVAEVGEHVTAVRARLAAH